MTAAGACAIPGGDSVTSPVNLASVSLKPPTYVPLFLPYSSPGCRGLSSGPRQWPLNGHTGQDGLGYVAVTAMPRPGPGVSSSHPVTALSAMPTPSHPAAIQVKRLFRRQPAKSCSHLASPVSTTLPLPLLWDIGDIDSSWGI